MPSARAVLPLPGAPAQPNSTGEAKSGPPCIAQKARYTVPPAPFEPFAVLASEYVQLEKVTPVNRRALPAIFFCLITSSTTPHASRACSCPTNPNTGRELGEWGDESGSYGCCSRQRSSVETQAMSLYVGMSGNTLRLSCRGHLLDPHLQSSDAPLLHDHPSGRKPVVSEFLRNYIGEQWRAPEAVTLV